MKRKNTIHSILNSCTKSNEKIITLVRGEIGKDNTRACVVICGVPFDDNASFYKELNLYVITNRCCKKTELKAGYSPKVSLLDFNGYGNDIYVTIDSGGSGGFQFFYIFEYNCCKLNLLISDDIFNSRYNNYTGCYLDYYKAQVVRARKVWRIDLSCKGYEYLIQIYNVDGTLIEPKQIYISGANYTYPQYNQSSKKYTLVVYQKIAGLYQADTLGYMETTLEFVGNEHEATSIYLKTQDDKSTDCMMM